MNKCANCLKAFEKDEHRCASLISFSQGIELCEKCLVSEEKRIAMYQTIDLPGLLDWYRR
jgi:hypothetical protein